MCVSFWAANFSHTITGTWEVLVDGKLQHVLWYQNRVGKGYNPQVFEVVVQKVTNHGWTVKDERFGQVLPINGLSEWFVQNEVNSRLKSLGRHDEVKTMVLPPEQANCLIIPLLGSWESIRPLNTTSAPTLLEDISYAVREPLPDGAAQTQGASVSWGGGGAIVFLKMGIYDIVIAENALDLPGALSQVDVGKRPAINDAVFEAMAEWYQCPIALCCFNNEQKGESTPLAFAFQPRYPDKLQVYTLDGHDGNPPDLRKPVQLDHTIFVGSYLADKRKCAIIDRTEISLADDLRPYLLDHVMGVSLGGKMQSMDSGDFVFDTEAVRRGHFEGARLLPPYAPAGLQRSGQKLTREKGYVVTG